MTTVFSLIPGISTSFYSFKAWTDCATIGDGFYWRLCYYIFRAKNDIIGSPITVHEPTCQQLSFNFILAKCVHPKSTMFYSYDVLSIPYLEFSQTLSALVSILIQSKRMTLHSTCALIGVITRFRGSTCAIIGDCNFYFFEA